MSKTTNKPYIDKCIVSFSHDRLETRKLADDRSLEKARREIAQGKAGVSHLILRAKDDEVDRLKFLFPIHGIPIMCYALGNLFLSSLEEIVVVGSAEVKEVLDCFLKVVGTHGKRVHFVHEDPDNLSLINTVLLGKNCLSLEPDELFLFQPGDLPFMYDFEKVIRDEDIETHNLILWLNSRGKMFPRHAEDGASEFVKRNYHYCGIDENTNEFHELKEPNTYPININAVEPDLFELLHSTRKDGQILKAGLKKVLSHPFRLPRLLSIIFYHLMHFQSDLKAHRPQGKYKMGSYLNNFDRGVEILINTSFITKLNDDPAFVSDVDALEDWEDFESLIAYSCQKHGDDGLSHVHPFGNELLRFKERGMPELKKQIALYADFPSYMNNLYSSLEMNQVPFNSQGHFNLLESQLTQAEEAYRWYSRKTEKFAQRA